MANLKQKVDRQVEAFMGIKAFTIKFKSPKVISHRVALNGDNIEVVYKLKHFHDPEEFADAIIKSINKTGVLERRLGMEIYQVNKFYSFGSEDSGPSFWFIQFFISKIQ